ncbi:IPT/TIG domain-containing protein [Myxococcota bacterium]|nr:IPT/TIG domain-containing protein [Myxococcota bacterium]
MARSSILLLLPALLAGCGLGAGLEQLAHDDSGLAQGPVWIDAVDPTWGPTAGGTAVSIRGGGFSGDVSVLFGSAELAVTVVDDTELVVTSPSTSVEVAVDVTVRTELGEAVLADGFVYSDDGPPDTGDGGAADGGAGDGGGGDGGGGGSEAGKVSGAVEFYYEVIACPSCFGVTEQLNVGAVATFHSPVSGTWTDWLPARGSCSTTASPAGPNSDTRDVGEWVYLESGTTSHGLRRVSAGGQTQYEVTGLAQGDWVRNSAWDLSVSEGGAWGPFNLSAVVKTTEGFEDVQPIAILNDGPQAFGAQISPTGATFSWSPAGIADGFLVIVDVYSASGTTFLGRVACYDDDTGSMTLPSSGLSGYPSGALLAIYLYRHQVEEAINPVDGSTVQGISLIGAIGTGTLR